jgi:hypothetical protein
MLAGVAEKELIVGRGTTEPPPAPPPPLPLVQAIAVEGVRVTETGLEAVRVT